DGIRDDLVTGVQTCALPISTRPRRSGYFLADRRLRWRLWRRRLRPRQRRHTIGRNTETPARAAPEPGGRQCPKDESRKDGDKVEIGRASCRGGGDRSRGGRR